MTDTIPPPLGIIQAINAGDRIALHALADYYEENDHHALSSAIRTIQARGWWPQGPFTIKWFDLSAVGAASPVEQNIPSELFSLLSSRVSTIIHYALTYPSIFDAILDLAHAITRTKEDRS